MLFSSVQKIFIVIPHITLTYTGATLIGIVTILIRQLFNDLLKEDIHATFECTVDHNTEPQQSLFKCFFWRK